MYYYIDKSIVLTLLILVSGFQINGQQETHYSNFMVSGVIVNSAYYGYKEATELNLSYRNQWFNFEGAPSTITTTLSIPTTKKISGGVYLLHDRIGVSKNTVASPGLSYKIKGQKVTVQLGMNVGVSSYTIDWSQAKTIEDSDPVYSGIVKETKMIPILGTGIILYNEKLFFGLSSPNLVESSFSNVSERNNYQRHLFLTTAYVLEFMPQNIKIKTGIYSKYTQNSPLSLNFGLSVIFMDKVIAGTVVNPKGNVSLQAQYFFNTNFSTGFSYDFLTNRLTRSQKGTLEIYLSYLMIKNKSTIYSPRYF